MLQDTTTATYNATETGLLGYLAASGGAIGLVKNIEIMTLRQQQKMLLKCKSIVEEAAAKAGLSCRKLFTQAEGG